MATNRVSFKRGVEERALKDPMDELDAQLEIDENDLDEALLRQPRLYFMVSKQLAIEISKRDAAKQYLATVEARTDHYIRRQARSSDDKLTEGEIKAQVQLHADVENAQKDVRKHSLEVGKWQALEKSYDQRMKAISKLVDLFLKNYWQESGLNSSSGSMKDYNASVARKGMAEQRRKRDL